MAYNAPLKDMLFVMKELAALAEISTLPGCEDATAEIVQAVLEENAKFCAEVLAPLNASGDRQPGSWQEGQVTTTPGFRSAFQSFCDSGWQGLQHAQEFGGQGLPKLLAVACTEMLNAANLAFALCPLLTDGAIEALLVAGSDAQQQAFIPHFISGRWTGTMNLTESQAGSDLSLVRCRAERQTDGTYKLFGTKIFITYGDHDMAENIVHFVLARVPDAPEGVKGLSLFIVPKYLIGSDGTCGAKNDVQCVALEHKLGIKASPTVTLQFGDQGGATGELLGGLHRGLETMFIMMNAARFAVGVQGIALAERAYQHAVEYAKNRVQSRDVSGSAQAVAIIHHPDVQRMLMSMRAQIEAARALAYVGAAACDRARHHPDAAIRADNQAFYELLVPIIKGWCTELAIEVASTGIQVHGGMGFIEETGAAQYYRDARILTIYEGTTAIQANDLVQRKTVRDGGAVLQDVLQDVLRTAQQLNENHEATFQVMGAQLAQAVQALQVVMQHVLTTAHSAPRQAFAASVPYLKLAGIVLGGWQITRAALLAQQRPAEEMGTPDADFYDAKILTARFFADHILSQADGLQHSAVTGSACVNAVTESYFIA